MDKGRYFAVSEKIGESTETYIYKDELECEITNEGCIMAPFDSFALRDTNFRNYYDAETGEVILTLDSGTEIYELEERFSVLNSKEESLRKKNDITWSLEQESYFSNRMGNWWNELSDSEKGKYVLEDYGSENNINQRLETIFFYNEINSKFGTGEDSDVDKDKYGEYYKSQSNSIPEVSDKQKLDKINIDSFDNDGIFYWKINGRIFMYPAKSDLYFVGETIKDKETIINEKGEFKYYPEDLFNVPVDYTSARAAITNKSDLYVDVSFCSDPEHTDEGACELVDENWTIKYIVPFKGWIEIGTKLIENIEYEEKGFNVSSLDPQNRISLFTRNIPEDNSDPGNIGKEVIKAVYNKTGETEPEIPVGDETFNIVIDENKKATLIFQNPVGTFLDNEIIFYFKGENPPKLEEIFSEIKVTNKSEDKLTEFTNDDGEFCWQGNNEFLQFPKHLVGGDGNSDEYSSYYHNPSGLVSSPEILGDRAIIAEFNELEISEEMSAVVDSYKTGDPFIFNPLYFVQDWIINEITSSITRGSSGFRKDSGVSGYATLVERIEMIFPFDYEGGETQSEDGIGAVTTTNAEIGRNQWRSNFTDVITVFDGTPDDGDRALKILEDIANYDAIWCSNGGDAPIEAIPLTSGWKETYAKVIGGSLNLKFTYKLVPLNIESGWELVSGSSDIWFYKETIYGTKEEFSGLAAWEQISSTQFKQTGASAINFDKVNDIDVDITTYISETEYFENILILDDADFEIKGLVPNKLFTRINETINYRIATRDYNYSATRDKFFQYRVFRADEIDETSALKPNFWTWYKGIGDNIITPLIAQETTASGSELIICDPNDPNCNAELFTSGEQIICSLNRNGDEICTKKPEGEGDEDIEVEGNAYWKDGYWFIYFDVPFEINAEDRIVVTGLDGRTFNLKYATNQQYIIYVWGREDTPSQEFRKLQSNKNEGQSSIVKSDELDDNDNPEYTITYAEIPDYEHFDSFRRIVVNPSTSQQASSELLILSDDENSIIIDEQGNEKVKKVWNNSKFTIDRGIALISNESKIIQSAIAEFDFFPL